MITYSDLLIWSAHELCRVTHPPLVREAGMGELGGGRSYVTQRQVRGGGASKSCPPLPRGPALGGSNRAAVSSHVICSAAAATTTLVCSQSRPRDDN